MAEPRESFPHPPDHYEALGISRGEFEALSAEEKREAVRQALKAKQGELGEAELEELKERARVLTSAKRRAAYDATQGFSRPAEPSLLEPDEEAWARKKSAEATIKGAYAEDEEERTKKLSELEKSGHMEEPEETNAAQDEQRREEAISAILAQEHEEERGRAEAEDAAAAKSILSGLLEEERAAEAKNPNLKATNDAKRRRGWLLDRLESLPAGREKSRLETEVASLDKRIASGEAAEDWQRKKRRLDALAEEMRGMKQETDEERAAYQEKDREHAQAVREEYEARQLMERLASELHGESPRKVVVRPESRGSWQETKHLTKETAKVTGRGAKMVGKGGMATGKGAWKVGKGVGKGVGKTVSVAITAAALFEEFTNIGKTAWRVLWHGGVRNLWHHLVTRKGLHWKEVMREVWGKSEKKK